MEDNVIEEVKMIQKVIKGFFGILGGGAAVATLLMGLYFMINFSLPLVGALVIAMAPLEILLTKKAMDGIQVIPPIEEDDEIKSKLTVIKCSDDVIMESDRQQGVEFTKIKPMVHLEIVDCSNKNHNKTRNK